MIPPSVAEEARLFPQQGNSHLKYAVPKRCPDAFLIDLLAELAPASKVFFYD